MVQQLPPQKTAVSGKNLPDLPILVPVNELSASSKDFFSEHFQAILAALVSSFSDSVQIKALHQYDCLRANKSTFAWGLEARVPFLDKEFINVAMNIDPEYKMVCTCCDKWITTLSITDFY